MTTVLIPKVLIIVKAGIAEYYAEGDVQIEMRDFDVLDIGEPIDELPEAFAALWPEEAQGIRDANARIGGIE